MVKKFLILWMLTFSQSAYALLDLNTLISDFVLEERRITVRGCEEALNPSIIIWQGKKLLCFRTSDGILQPPPSAKGKKDPPSPHPADRLGLVWLDEEFKPIGSLQILNFSNYAYPLMQFDPRLVIVNEKLFVVFSDLLAKNSIRRMFFAELVFDGHLFQTINPRCIQLFDGENIKRQEKNWSPFDYKGRLFFSYSINPHKVLTDFGEEYKTVAETNAPIDWDWGELRGGTPAVLEGKEYLAFFHSCKKLPSKQTNGQELRHYFMGAYTFSSEPPFQITRISPVPIIGRQFYGFSSHKTWEPLLVVFPCGYILDGPFIWIAYGRQDSELWVVKLDKQKMFDSLIQVSHIVD